MIIATSLSPNHANKDIQKSCLASWRKHGEIVCFQWEGEIKSLKSEYPDITFVKAKTTQQLIGKPLVSINSMLDYAISKKQDILIINSDIFLTDFPSCKKNGISIFQRCDYARILDEGCAKFTNGWDAFFIPKELVSIYPPSIYSMGNCWWDYWIPYRAIRENIPVYQMNGYAYHKKHDLQWDNKSWLFFGQYFRLENSLAFTNVQQMGSFVLDTIKKNVK